MAPTAFQHKPDTASVEGPTRPQHDFGYAAERPAVAALQQKLLAPSFQGQLPLHTHNPVAESTSPAAMHQDAHASRSHKLPSSSSAVDTADTTSPGFVFDVIYPNFFLVANFDFSAFWDSTTPSNAAVSFDPTALFDGRWRM